MSNVIDLEEKKQQEKQFIQDNRASMQGLALERYVFSEAAFREQHGLAPDNGEVELSEWEKDELELDKSYDEKFKEADAIVTEKHGLIESDIKRAILVLRTMNELAEAK